MRLVYGVLAALAQSARAFAPIEIDYAEIASHIGEADGYFEDVYDKFMAMGADVTKARLKALAAKACGDAGFTKEQCVAALERYKTWRATHDVTYDTFDELVTALHVFKDRWLAVSTNEKLFAENKIPYRLTLTKFADNADEDKLIKKLGLRDDREELLGEWEPHGGQRTLAKRGSPARRLSTETNYSHARRLAAMPAVKTSNRADWAPWLGEVPNQHPCESCWAFAASVCMLGAMHLAEATKKGHKMSDYPQKWLKDRFMSEQQMMDCNAGWEDNDPVSCELGGSVQKAFAAVSKTGKLKGVALRSAQPYKGDDGTCNKKASTLKTTLSCDKLAAGCNSKSSKPYMCPKASELSNPEYVDTLKEMLEYAPVAIAVSSCSLPSSYAEGVYPQSKEGEYPHTQDCWKPVKDGGECTRSYCPKVDHAVTLVGWGWDEKAKLSYWKIRNSWGNGKNNQPWGDKGYIKIERTANNMNMKGKDPCIPLGPQYA